MNVLNLLAMSGFLSKLADNTNFIIIGFTIVCFVLLCLSCMMKFIGIFFTQKEKKALSGNNSQDKDEARRIKAVVKAATMVVKDQLVADTSDPKLVAVISAAVAHMLKNKRYAIREIRIAPKNDNHWSSAGRQTIFSSHKFRVRSK